MIVEAFLASHKTFSWFIQNQWKDTDDQCQPTHNIMQNKINFCIPYFLDRYCSSVHIWVYIKASIPGSNVPHMLIWNQINLSPFLTCYCLVDICEVISYLFIVVSSLNSIIIYFGDYSIHGQSPSHEAKQFVCSCSIFSLNY